MSQNVPRVVTYVRIVYKHLNHSCITRVDMEERKEQGLLS